MKQLGIVTALAVLALTMPAAAEPMRMAQGAPAQALPPYEVLTIVRSTGLDPIGQPMRRGPNYVMRAMSGDGRELLVVVNAQFGDIVSMRPVVPGPRPLPLGVDDSRALPPGVTMGPYERMDPPGYIPPAPGVYQAGPPSIYQPEPPIGYGRPPAPISQATGPGDEPPPVITATPPAETDYRTASRPRGAETPGLDHDGLLPPPPERFPKRAAPAPAAKPKPAKRTAAAPPKPAPLPKRKPDVDAAPIPPYIPDDKPADKPKGDAMPN